METNQPPGPIHPSTMISTITTLVILGVIVYLAVKNPAELTVLFKTYVYFVLGLLLILSVLAVVFGIFFKA